jgi:hypothetical protein
MYPRREVTIDSSMPAGASFWVPKPSDVNDEGIGCYFRDVWPLIGVSTSDTRALIVWERRAAEYVNRESQSEERFEELAAKIEDYLPDDIDAELPDEIAEGATGLGGLELGVAGLTYSLSNAGFYPAASCRSHVERSWSPEPVVLFAADERRLQLFQPLVAEADCGLAFDESRGEPLFAVYSRSIAELMELAGLLFEKRSEFRRLPKTGRRRSTTIGSPRLRAPHPTLF